MAGQGGRPMQVAAAREASSEPSFGRSLATDAKIASDYVAVAEAMLSSLGPKADRAPEQQRQADELKARIRAVKERFFRSHVAEIYDDMTKGCTETLRVGELLYAVAEQYPSLLPTRERILAERALMQQ